MSAGKDFGEVTILENVTFEVQPGERVGLIGDNGTGKTTLFKMISGEYACDKGSVHIAPGTRVGVLDQIPYYPDGTTVEQVLRGAFERLDGIAARMRELERRMSEGDAQAVREYGALEIEFSAGGGYDTEVQFRRVANGLGLTPMLETRWEKLSGGERTRINLARMILTDVDLMLLDEPTNHLDIQSTEWLEDFLASFKGSVLIISHDRYFLDRTVGRIVELEGGTAKVWNGNYSEFLRQKEEYIRSAEAQMRNAEKKVKQLEDAVKRVRLWAFLGNDKLYRTAFSMEKRIARIKASMPKLVKQGRNLRATFGETRRSGEDVLSVTGLKKSFGDRTLFSDVDLEIKKDERVGLIGANGAGKTTLLNILLGKLPPDEGRVKWGVGVKTAYLPQMVSFEYNHTTIVDSVCRTLSISEAEARNILARFNFTGEDVFKDIDTLSGGEKSRLRLCILMQGGVNMLILDEPTNHLDIRSREWLEQAIDEFDGTLLLVSHDRYFLEKFATKIWSVEQGGIIDFDGTYSEYREVAETLRTARESAVPPTEPQKKEPEPKKEQEQSEAREAHKRSRETDALRKRVPIIERRISVLEDEIKQIDEELTEASSDHIRLGELLTKREETEHRIDMLMLEWSEIMEKLGE